MLSIDANVVIFNGNSFHNQKSLELHFIYLILSWKQRFRKLKMNEIIAWKIAVFSSLAPDCGPGNVVPLVNVESVLYCADDGLDITRII